MRSTMALIKLSKCFVEPKYFLKFIAILLCLCIATYQLSGCINKILNPPTSTHSSFQLNHTLQYPVVTICSNPGFKTDLFAKYGVTELSTPAFPSFWNEFNFANYTLDEFFIDTTFALDDVLPLRGFDGRLDALDVEEVIKLTYGKCFRLTPKVVSNRWEKTAGYCLYLMGYSAPLPARDGGAHVSDRMAPQLLHFEQQAKNGFHVFLHEGSELIADDGNQSDSYMEHIYVQTGQDLKFSLSVNAYKQLPSTSNCRNDQNYSKSACMETCLAEMVPQMVGCSTPWLANAAYPRCDNYEDVKTFIKFYNKYRRDDRGKCDCTHACNLTIYLPYVDERNRYDYHDQSALTLYYLSNLVTVIEEVAVYDWSLFLSDLGGSLGFMLGVSVLGLISMVHQLFKICFGLRDKSTESASNAINNSTYADQKHALHSEGYPAIAKRALHEEKCVTKHAFDDIYI